jgi:1-acyl-sn-glycerol-3-phosphate acyltransferase
MIIDIVKLIIFIFLFISYSLIVYIFSWNNNKFLLLTGKLIYFLYSILGVKIKIYGDELDFNTRFGIISNHRCSHDITLIMIISSHYNKLIKFVAKKTIGNIPGVGWWIKRMNYPLISRDKSAIKVLKEYKIEKGETVVIFPEGTRYTKKKQLKYNKFSEKYNLSKYTLPPRSIGSFNLLANKNLDVYIQTIIYEKNYTIFPKIIKVYFKKVNSKQIPTTEDEFEKWINNEFREIGKIYENKEKYLHSSRDINFTLNKYDYISILNLIFNIFLISIFFYIFSSYKFMILFTFIGYTLLQICITQFF